MRRVPRITAEEVQAYSLRGMGLPEAIFDDKAWTEDELNRSLHQSHTKTTQTIREKVASGEWEQVWKRSPSGRKCRAYRPRKAQR